VETSELTGTVLEIQRMSTEDGPGIRTTVFMKGCPMRCLWCHNPESISPLPQIQWIGIRCIGCKTCIGTCPNAALKIIDNRISIDRTNCDGCGSCVEECPSTALELLGKEWTVADLANEMAKDAIYYDQSGGGVTVSGGESTLQWKFVTALLAELKHRGIHTAIDTCGIVKQDALEAILPNTDLILYDLKEMDPYRHQDYTHSPLNLVFDTFKDFVQRIQKSSGLIELWVRTPLIPGATARSENITAIGKFIAREGKGIVSRWDLLAFNNLCKDKYTRLGMDWQFSDQDLLDKQMLEDLTAVAKNSGVDPGIIHVSGSMKLDECDLVNPYEQVIQSNPTCGC
jgi:pyruvate formate lyase activating enzyme